MNDITYRRPIEWDTSQLTDVGMVRKVNEDAIFAKPELGLWAVADGMGGHAVGDVASRMIVEALDEVDEQSNLSDFVDAVENALIDVNRRIIDYAQLMFDSATMGSTVACLLIRGRVGVCLWAGDSRLYRLRNQQLSQLSRDHSHVQELLEMGEIEEHEVDNHPQGNVITRAIGVDPEGKIDINVFNAQMGDTFLLCSDGLHNTVDQNTLVALLSSAETDKVADNLVHASLDKGAPDNVSVVIVRGEAATIGYGTESL